MSVPVTLFATGMVRDVEAKVKEIADQFGPDDGTVWIQPGFPPTGNDAEYEGCELFFDVEVFDADRRSEAIARVAEAVRAVDPDFAVITSGDIFKREVEG